MAINFTSLATSALGFTLALAWNDAVVKSISAIAPAREKEAHMSFIYAGVVTLLVLLIAFVVNCGRKVYLKLYGKTSPPSAPRPAPGTDSIVRLWAH